MGWTMMMMTCVRIGMLVVVIIEDYDNSTDNDDDLDNSIIWIISMMDDE